MKSEGVVVGTKPMACAIPQFFVFHSSLFIDMWALSCYHRNNGGVMKGFAKINLFLNVYKKDAFDDLHPIYSVFLPCSDIFDEVVVSRCDGDNRVEFFIREGACGFADSSRFAMQVRSLAGGDNVAKAVELFSKKFNIFGIAVAVYKGIPFGAGLGGSSASVAGVLVALCEKFAIDLRAVSDIARAVGSDVLGMMNGLCFVDGAELCEPIADRMGLFAVVCVPDFGVSTRDVFAKFDEVGGELFDYGEDFLCGGIDPTSQLSEFKNSLEKPAFLVEPRLVEFLDALKNASGRDFLMTGSGSGFFCLVQTKQEAEEILEKVKNICEFCAVSRV